MKKTDKQKLVELLTEFGVGFTDEKKHDIIRCMDGDDKITGYGMFYTDFEFDKDGKFIQIGAWE